jgi:predicted nucleotidyltransferase
MAATPEDLANALVRRHRHAIELQHERAREVRRRIDEALREADRAGRFRRAFLIGSLAHGTFGVGSDVDVVVEGLASDDAGALYGALVAAAGTEVDLLRMEELPQSFRARVEQEGVLLYGP